MGTSLEDIREWFDVGKKNHATHMIVVCNTYDYEDYPKYVYPGQDVHQVERELNNPDRMSKVMEVYYLLGDRETQLNQRPRSFNYDNSTIKVKPPKSVFGIKIRKMMEIGEYRYSTGGCDALRKEKSWTTRGKVWASEGHVKSHLTMLTESWGGKRPTIPEDWEVVTMYEDGTTKVQSARELAERPAKK